MRGRSDAEIVIDRILHLQAVIDKIHTKCVSVAFAWGGRSLR